MNRLPKFWVVENDNSQLFKDTVIMYLNTIYSCWNWIGWKYYWYDWCFSNSGTNCWNAIEDFQNNIKSDIQKKCDEFLKTIDLPLERLELRIMRGSMNHKLFMELISPMRIDLVCLHTTGVYSFFAFDILESSTLDVLMYKI